LTRFSVVIPTYQRRETVLRSVMALRNQSFRDFEAIVVVDGSTDGTAEALRSLEIPFPLRVVEQPNSGRAAAVNAGAAAASGELLLFLDDDMSADPQLLAEHERSHREGADVVMGDLPLDPNSPRNLLSWGVGSWAETRRQRLCEPEAEIGIADLLTGQMSIERGAFEEVGGFDVSFTREGLFGGEDLDLGYRLLKAGRRIVFNPDAISYQYYAVDPGEYLKRARETGRSDRELVTKHPELSQRLEASPRFTSRRSKLMLAPFLRLPQAGAAPLRALAVAAVHSRLNTPRLRRLFFAVRTLEYQRGWRNAEPAHTLGRGEAIVLAYHSLSDLSGDRVLAQYGITGETLAAQLDHLAAHGHNFVDLDLLLAALDGSASLPERATLITFDDAYADLLPTAVEVLSSRKIPAIVFAVSGRIGGANEWDRHLGASELALLDAKGLQALTAAGIEIGSHSVNHPQLTKVSDEKVVAEVRESAGQIEAAGLPRPRAFAFPHGEWDARATAAVAAAGYAAGFTIDPGRVRPGGNRFALPRIEVLASDTNRTLRLKLATARWPQPIRNRILRAAGAKR
jgi:glycosyltransferase involved in cell wall biosynthesis/peptidoglycan/xylan/chitin deacetylase (PgdA/CDA1 family)